MFLSAGGNQASYRVALKMSREINGDKGPVLPTQSELSATSTKLSKAAREDFKLRRAVCLMELLSTSRLLPRWSWLCTCTRPRRSLASEMITQRQGKIPFLSRKFLRDMAFKVLMFAALKSYESRSTVEMTRNPPRWITPSVPLQ